MHFKILMISDLKKKKWEQVFGLWNANHLSKDLPIFKNKFSKLIRRIHFLSYGKCIYKLYKCISDVKGGKKWERVFRSWNANNFSHGSSLPSSCLYFNLSCVPAHKMPRKAALFRQTGFSSFAKLNFLFSPMKNFYAAIAEPPPPVKSLRNEKAFRKTAV